MQSDEDLVGKPVLYRTGETQSSNKHAVIAAYDPERGIADLDVFIDHHKTTYVRQYGARLVDVPKSIARGFEVSSENTCWLI